MTVAEVSALLYLPGHPRQQLLRALRIPALSAGWKESLRALLDGEPGAGNPGLVRASPPPAWAGFRRLTATEIERESDSVISIRFDSPDGTPLPAARPGQYLTLRVKPDNGTTSLLRNYSICGPPDAGYYRIAVKREPDGAASGYLHARLAVGDQLDIAAPRGTFMLDATDAPVLLISAGIGATPVLAMLQALAEAHSDREVWWLHGARSGREHSFGAESRTLLASLPRVRARVCYSRPGPNDVEGRDFDSTGRLTGSLVAELEPPRDAEAYLCGPTPFMQEISAGLAAIGLGASRIHTEPFGPARRPARKRADDPVCPQQPRDSLEQRLREPPRVRGSLRRTRPLVLPHRRLPQLRNDAHRRQARLQPRSRGTARRRERPDLLFTAGRRRSARSVTASPLRMRVEPRR
jgi:ferredoxin-NADP reductase